MNLYTWGVRAFFAAQGVFWAWIGAVWARERFHRARRDMDQAVVLMCKPCRGEEGPHTCGRKLPGPDRPQASGVGTGEDTGVMTIDDEYRALLDKEAGRG